MSLKEALETAGSVLVSLGGGGAIVLALSGWLGKVWAERFLEKDRAAHAAKIELLKNDLDRTTRQYQAEIEKTLFVTKTHFESEFAILREIWQRVSEVRVSMLRLRPSKGFPNEPHEQVQYMQQNYPIFSNDLEALLHAVDHNSPFYPQEIFTLLDELIVLAQIERDDVQGGADVFTPVWFHRAAANHAKYLKMAQKISVAIRDRLSKLAVRGVNVQ